MPAPNPGISVDKAEPARSVDPRFKTSFEEFGDEHVEFWTAGVVPPGDAERKIPKTGPFCTREHNPPLTKLLNRIIFGKSEVPFNVTEVMDTNLTFEA
eukprot:371954_1